MDTVMATVASFESVEFLRDERVILTGINWTIDSSQRWVIVGPNGAGKTTLLAMLSSHLHPSSGDIQVLGNTIGKTDVFDLRSPSESVAMVCCAKWSRRHSVSTLIARRKSMSS